MYSFNIIKHLLYTRCGTSTKNISINKIRFFPEKAYHIVVNHRRAFSVFTNLDPLLLEANQNFSESKVGMCNLEELSASMEMYLVAIEHMK